MTKDEIDFSKYKVEEIIEDIDDKYDEFTKYLLGIINDRSIPENQKQLVKKQFDELMRMKNVTKKPPTIVLSPKE